MPKKKQPRNAFYFYAQDFKEEQRKNGIHYQNLAELMTAAGPSYAQLKPGQRAKYEAQAKAEKQKYNVPEMKFTSTGVPLAEIQRAERERQEAEEAERRDINNFVKLKSFDNSILDEDIFIMNVNYYCKVGSEYLIAESTVLRFSIREGIKDQHHSLINPVRIPMGYTSDVKATCAELGLEMPDDDEGSGANLTLALAQLVDFLSQGRARDTPVPPVYTLPDTVAPVKDYINQMCVAAAEDETAFRVYQLDLLLYALGMAMRRNSLEGFPRESLALAYLRKDTFRFTLGVTACESHKEGKEVECSLHRAQRWAYAVLDALCPLVDVPAQPGKHLPPTMDVEGIISYKEERQTAALKGAWCGRDRAGAAALSESADGSLSLSTTLGEVSLSDASFSSGVSSLAESSRSRGGGNRRSRFSDVDMRMPRTRPSEMELKNARGPPAPPLDECARAPPSLSEASFPALAIGGRGRGRGRLGPQ